MQVRTKLILFSLLSFSLGIFFSTLFFDSPQIQGKQLLTEKETAREYPPATQSGDYLGEKSGFIFSPDKKYIAFAEDVFEAYGKDYGRYWAVKIFDVISKNEKTIFVDDIHMSRHEWLDNETVRVFHSGGTGVHLYRDVPTSMTPPLFSKGYGPKFWRIDEGYVKRANNMTEAWQVYHSQ